MEVAIRSGQTDFKDIFIKYQNKVLSMYFMNVGDLFWSINKSNPHSIKETFDIPQTERDIYSLFDKLYKDINQAKLFKEQDDDYIKRKLFERNLFNPETKTIEWHSDETYFDSDDIVRIIKQKDNYHLEFTRPKVYEDSFHMGSPRMIYIRFRNTGSYYHPFNLAFMKMFKDAQFLQERGFKGLHKQDVKTKSDIER